MSELAEFDELLGTMPEKFTGRFLQEKAKGKGITGPVNIKTYLKANGYTQGSNSQWRKLKRGTPRPAFNFKGKG